MAILYKHVRQSLTMSCHLTCLACISDFQSPGPKDGAGLAYLNGRWLGTDTQNVRARIVCPKPDCSAVCRYEMASGECRGYMVVVE
jgi:hypothetical protein